MSNSRVGTALAVGLKERARNHVLVELIVFLPVYFIFLINVVAPDIDIPVWVTVDGLVVTVTAPMTEVYTVLMTPMVAALVAGIGGMFMMQASRDVDGRAVFVGYKPWELVASRLSVVAAITALVTAASLAVMWFFFLPQQLGWFVFAVFATGLTYGMIGILIGSVFDSLSGMYVMLFGPMLDVLVFQNPMITRGNPEPWMRLLPGHFPVSIAYQAAYTESIPVSDIGWAVASLGAFLILAVLTYTRQTQLSG